MRLKAYLLVIAMLVMSVSSLGVIASAAELTEITVTTGQQFVDALTAYGTLGTHKIIIKGTDDLADGSKGINLTNGLKSDYASFANFLGAIEGVDGGNNIQIDKPLFASFGGDVTIQNINLRPDSTGKIEDGSSQGYAALVSVIATAGKVNIENVSNYCDVTSSSQVGGIVGYPKANTISLTNCYNHGNITATGNGAGGICGYSTNGKSLTLTSCANYGSITAERYVGGLVGYTYNGTITKSFNAGSVTSNTRQAGGITSYLGKSGGTVSYCYNVGTVTTSYNSANDGSHGIAQLGATDVWSVIECYNAGTLTNTIKGASACCPLVYAGTNTLVSDTSNYYLADENATKASIGTSKTPEELAGGLDGLNFSTEVWEYTATSETQKYSLPQIKGNTFTTISDTWYVPSEGGEGGEGGDPVDPEPEPEPDPEPEQPENPYEINTAEEFKAADFNDDTLSWTLKGETDLGEGRIGIDLTGTDLAYASKVFAGTLKGVNGYNYVKVNKALFSAFTASKKCIIDNIILIGEISAAETYNGALVNDISQKNGTFEIKNVTSYVNLTTTSGYAGGLVGFSRYSDLKLENCVNYGNVTGTSYTGGLLSYARGNTVTANFCTNKGEISGGNYCGGIVGYTYTDAALNIEKCGNYGKVTSTLDRGANGIAGIIRSGHIKESFNAGYVYTDASRHACGIAFVWSAEGNTINIENCFNAGTVKSKTYASGDEPCGIVFHYKGLGTLAVANCYNVGDVFSTNKNTEKSNGYEITNSTTATVTNCYFTETDPLKTDIGTAGTYMLRHRLADKMDDVSLSTIFSSDVWEYDSTVDGTTQTYSYPQLKNNKFVTNDTSFYILTPNVSMEEAIVPEARKGVAESEDIELLDTTTGEQITGDYALIAVKFALKNVNPDEAEYGMLISETVSGEGLTIGNCDHKVKAKNSVESNGECSYGILFWGALKEGTRYYVRPYVVFDGETQYADATSFTIGQEI